MKSENRVFDWGESMYGGYYAEVFYDGEHKGLHEAKLGDLRKKAAELGLKLTKDRRVDH